MLAEESDDVLVRLVAVLLLEVRHPRVGEEDVGRQGPLRATLRVVPAGRREGRCGRTEDVRSHQRDLREEGQTRPQGHRKTGVQWAPDLYRKDTELPLG